LFTLYIPHGSDERKRTGTPFERAIKLYIPHGSDERKNTLGPGVMLSLLYIPHGSDESITLTYPVNFVSDFISHMVQMKDHQNQDY